MLEQELVTNSAYVLFYKRRGFNPQTAAEFEAIKIKSTGICDYLFNEPQPIGTSSLDTA